MSSQLLDKKLELIQWLSTLEDQSLIEKLFELKKKETQDWWNNLANDEKISIMNGLDNAVKSNTKSHSEVRKTYEKWL
jgi:hypothetical protein